MMLSTDAQSPLPCRTQDIQTKLDPCWTVTIKARGTVKSCLPAQILIFFFFFFCRWPCLCQPSGLCPALDERRYTERCLHHLHQRGPQPAGAGVLWHEHGRRGLDCELLWHPLAPTKLPEQPYRIEALSKGDSNTLSHTTPCPAHPMAVFLHVVPITKAPHPILPAKPSSTPA